MRGFCGKVRVKQKRASELLLEVGLAGKDITEKALEALNDVFADIINVLLFDGEEIVKADELEQGRERGDYTGELGNREYERDSSKFWRKSNLRISYFGIENETEPENDMPFRVIGYDGAGYRDQISYYKGEDGKRHKSTLRYPVITLVLNLDYKKKWDKARSLHEALGNRIPEKLKPYVKDYELNIFDIAFLSEAKIKKFRSDFRIVADYLYQMRTNADYIPNEQTIIHVREVLNFMSVVTDDARFREVAEEIVKGDEPKNMCTVLDKVQSKGKQEGRKETGDLLNFLWSNGRGEEAKKAVSDQALFDKLFAEFKATDPSDTQ